jgi:hypothetical protein
MAGDWIKFELTTLDKPEVCQIADLANIDPDAAVGKLMRVWGWFDQQTENGNAPSVSKKLLDRMVGVTGFCEHMKSVGWMAEADGVISLPHFDRHNGKTAKNRLLTAKRVANHKSANAKGNAPSVSDALPKEDVEKKDSTHTPGGPFAMFLDWAPDQKVLKAYSFRSGLAMSVFTPEAIAGFVLHHDAKGECQTEKQWVAALVGWVSRDRARGSRVVPFVPRSSSGPDFNDTSWAENLGGL